jgi:hypothetical protein
VRESNPHPKSVTESNVLQTSTVVLVMPVLMWMEVRIMNDNDNDGENYLFARLNPKFASRLLHN